MLISLLWNCEVGIIKREQLYKVINSQIPKLQTNIHGTEIQSCLSTRLV